MRDTNETALLRSIAEEGDDNSGRLILADWLEEHGEGPRAEFVRVQCELATPKLAKPRRQALRLRERELLDRHRQDWLQAFDLPMEDVRFERGLLAGMRLSEWNDGKLLDAEHAPRLATLTELDLSGLGIGDTGLQMFAQKADFPALRKLILSDNGIGNDGILGGAIALVKSASSRLDTIYLFQNPLSDEWRKSLKKATGSPLINLDLGQCAEGYCMSPGQAEVARRQYIREHLLPVAAKNFQTYEHLQSAMLCVAQYWADEADDAVHGHLVVSELFEPVLEGVSWSDESGTDPNVPNTSIKREYGESGSMVSLWEAGAQWDDNNAAIPLWAAFAPEEGSQEYQYLSEVYAPAVMFYRHGGYEILPMRRPHLDGIRPQWDEEE